MADAATIRTPFVARYRKPLLGGLAVVLFFAAWQAIFLVVPFNPLFISKPSAIADGYVDLIESGDLFHDLAVSAVPFFVGLVRGRADRRAARHRHGLASARRLCARSADDDFLRQPAGGTGAASGDLLRCRRAGQGDHRLLALGLPFIFNACAGVRAVDRLLINVVRSLGGGEWALYSKVIFPSVLPYIVAGARIAVGRALIGVLVGEFFAASEGIGYAISRFGDIFAIDRMFACILTVMVIAVVLTEGIRWAERAAFPWRAGQ